jgi:Tfp pilus assembly protein PilX
VALPVAISILLIVSIMVTVASSVAISLNSAANRDSNTKRALEAAEAGLQIASYRINMLSPSNDKCVTNAAVPPNSGQCPGWTQSLGNDAQFTFYTTTALSSTDTCAGMRVQATSQLVQRCVTSIGTAVGATRRVQVRVAAYNGNVFPLPGILATSSVTIGNNAHIDGTLGTNGTLTVGSNVTGDVDAELGPSGTKTGVSDDQTTYRNTQQGPFVLSPYDYGNSATNNDNQRIVNGTDVSSGVTYTAATRMLNMGSGSITLGGGSTGTYNFCGMYGSGATITVAAGARIKILIDSPDRAGSGCPSRASNSKSGVLDFDGGVTFNNASQDPTGLQLYVWGYDDGTNTISIRNNADFYGTLYAPNSSLVLKNNADFYGAFAVKSFTAQNNFNFYFDPRVALIEGRSVGIYYRTAWRECPPAPTNPSDPKSGC